MSVDVIRTLGLAELWHLGMTIARWAANWVMSRLGPFPLGFAKIRAPERPLFFDMDPAFGVDVSPGARRGQRTSNYPAALRSGCRSCEDNWVIRRKNAFTLYRPVTSGIPGAGEGEQRWDLKNAIYGIYADGDSAIVSDGALFAPCYPPPVAGRGSSPATEERSGAPLLPGHSAILWQRTNPRASGSRASYPRRNRPGQPDRISRGRPGPQTVAVGR